MTLHLTPALEQRLDRLAALTNQTPDELAQEGMESFLDYEERGMATVARGRTDITAGRVVDHEEVVARMAALLKGNEDHLDRRCCAGSFRSRPLPSTVQC